MTLRGSVSSIYEVIRPEMTRGSSVFKPTIIAEELHDRIEGIVIRAYGFQNFENFRLRIKKFFFTKRLDDLISSDRAVESFSFAEKPSGTLLGQQNGVTDGARTRDNRNHNPGLYRLSYGHHKNLEFASNG